MIIYTCRFCDYNTKNIQKYYCHLYNHIDLDNIETFTKDELVKANHYFDKHYEYHKKYYQQHKERITQLRRKRQKKTRL